MADNVTTQSATPATPPAGVVIATIEAAFSGDTVQAGVAILAKSSGAEGARVLTLINPATEDKQDAALVLLALIAAGTSVPVVADYHKVSAGSNNADVVKNSAGHLYKVAVFSRAAYPVYVKLYDLNVAPAPATDVPIRTVGVQAGLRADDTIAEGLPFATGIGIAIVKGIADDDDTAVLADDVVVDVTYGD